jgi:chromosome segregation ATPase
MKKESQKTKENKTRDQYTVVLEDLRSNFKAFGESLDFVRNDVSSLNKKVDRMDMRLERVEGDVVLLGNNVNSLKNNVNSLKNNVNSLKNNGNSLNQKLERIDKRLEKIERGNVFPTKDEFKLLDSRILHLEKLATHN